MQNSYEIKPMLSHRARSDDSCRSIHLNRTSGAAAKSVTCLMAALIMSACAVLFTSRPASSVIIWMIAIASFGGCIVFLNRALVAHQRRWHSLLPSAIALGAGIIVVGFTFLITSGEQEKGPLYLGIAMFIAASAYAIRYNSKLFGMSDGVIISLIQFILSLMLVAVLLLVKMSVPETRKRSWD